MKYIQLKVEDELHKEIKLKAIESGKTIPEYVLDCEASRPINDGRVIIAMNRLEAGDYLRAVEREHVIEIWSIREEIKPTKETKKYSNVMAQAEKHPKAGKYLKEAKKTIKADGAMLKGVKRKCQCYGAVHMKGCKYL